MAISITGFDVAIGSNDKWYPVTIVPIDQSRVLNNGIAQAGREFRYWRLKVKEGSSEGQAEGRLLIAGDLAINNPAGTVVLPKGEHRTWIRFRDGSEVVIESAGTLPII